MNHNVDSINHVHELWFQDGNVVFQAESNIYRLYRGILIKRSEFFKSVLSSDTITTIPQYNGCPFIRLDDSSKDATIFFKAIFDSSFFEAPGTETSLSIISSVLRLSIKYQTPYLIHRCILHFHTAYPTSLPSWAKRESIRTIPPLDNTPFAILLLSVEIKIIPWILPSIYYCLSTHPLSDTLNPVQWEGNLIQLGWEQIKTFAIGRSKLMHQQMRYAVEYLMEGEDNLACEDKGECQSIRRKVVDEIVGWGWMGDWVEEIPTYFQGLCNPCTKGFHEFYDRSTKEWWSNLPGFFGLPEWDELERLKREALAS